MTDAINTDDDMQSKHVKHIVGQDNDLQIEYFCVFLKCACASWRVFSNKYSIKIHIQKTRCSYECFSSLNFLLKFVRESFTNEHFWY